MVVGLNRVPIRDQLIRKITTIILIINTIDILRAESALIGAITSSECQRLNGTQAGAEAGGRGELSNV